jgi:hypothetical protein
LSEKPRINTLWLWIALSLLCILAYWPMFGNGFVWDDKEFITGNPTIRSLWPITRFFQPQGSAAEGTIYPMTGQRPVMAFSLALDYRLWAYNPFGYHLTNLFLHLLCVWGVTRMAWLLSRSRGVGFWAGALFALHPGHAEGVIAFLGRSDLLATLFTLTGFLAYVQWKKGEGGRKAIWYLFSLTSFSVTCLSKESGLCLLGILIVYQGCILSRRKKEWAGHVLAFVPFVLASILYWVYRGKILGGQASGSQWWGGSPGANFLMMFEVYARYLRLLFFPLTLSPLHSVLVPKGFWDWRVLWGALVLFGTLWGTLYALRRFPRVGFLASWFLIGLIPVANLIPIPGVMILAERWLYLPSVGICVLGGWGAWLLYQQARGWIRWSWVGLVLVGLSLFGTRIFLWNRTWKTEETISRAFVTALPDNAFGYNNLGAALYEQGKLRESEDVFRKAIQLDPEHVQAHVNLGNMLDDSGRLFEAEGEYRQAIRLDPKYTLAYYNLAVVLIHQNRKGEAAEVLETYLAQGGKNRDEAEAMIHNLRGH